MADNIGNVNIALGIDKVKLEADLREVERELGRINDQFKNMGKGVSVKDQLTAKMNELRKAFDLLPMAQKNEKGLADVNSAANRLVQQFLKLRETQDKAGLSLDQYVKKLKSQGVGYDAAIGMGRDASSINQRKKAIEELTKVRNNLSTTDENYTKKLAVLNREIGRLAEANKKASDTGVSLQKQTVKFADAAAWASRKLVFYTSIYTLQRFAEKLAQVRGEFELQQKSLAAIIGNKEEADKIFARTVDLALQSPFKLRELVGYVRELSAYRIETEKLFDTTKMLADVSAGLGVDMGRLILAYGQVRSASVLRGQELRQFTEAGIPIIAELAKSFSELYGRVVKTDEVFEMVSKRMVSFEMVDEIFKRMTSSGGVFYNMQKIQSETLKGKISNLNDAFDIMYNKIGKDNEGVLKGVIDTFTAMLKNVDILIANFKALVLGLGIYKASVIATNLVNGKFKDTLIIGNGVLKAYTGSTYTAAYASMSFEKGMNLSSKANVLFQKTALLSKAALMGLKTAFMAFLPAAIIGVITEAVVLLIDYQKRVRELKDATDEANIAVLKSGKTIDDNIARLIQLSGANKDSTKAIAERSRIISEMTSINGDLGDSIADIYEKEKDQIKIIEKLNKLREEQNKFAQYQVFLNQQVLGSADGGTTTIKDDILELEKANNKLIVAQGNFNNEWILYEQTLRNAIKTGSLEGQKLNAERVKQIQDIVNSTKTAKEKFLEVYKLNYGRVDESLAESYREAYSNYKPGIFYDRFAKDAAEANAKVGKSIRRIARDNKAWITDQFGEISKLSQEQIKQINKSLEALYGKEYALQIRLWIGLPQQKPTEQLLTGWKFQAKKILGGLFNELVPADATLLSTLDDVSKKRDEAKSQLNNYNNALSKKNQLSKKEVSDLEESAKKLNAEISLYDQLLNRYGYVEKKSNGEKNIRKERVDNIEREIDVIKKAQEAYEKYLQVMSPEKAKKAAALAFNIDESKIGDVSDTIKAYEDIIKSLNKVGGKEAKEAIAKINDLIGGLKRDTEINIRLKGLETAQSEMDKLFKDYELTIEVGELTGFDVSGIIPEAVSFEQMIAKVNSKILELRASGGEKELELAKNLEDRVSDITINKKKETLEKLKGLIEQYGTKEEKIQLIQAQLTNKKEELAYINFLEDKLKIKNDYRKAVLQYEIKAGEESINLIKDEAVKSLEAYKALFSNIGDYTTSQLYGYLKQMKTAVSNARKTSDGKFEIKIGEEISTLSPEAYFNLLKQIYDKSDELAQKNPFKGFIEAINDIKTAKPEERLGKIAKALTTASYAFAQLSELSSSVGGLAEILGADQSTLDIINGVGETLAGLGKTSGGIAKIMQGDIIGGVSDFISGIAQSIKGIFTISDAKFKETIERNKEWLKDVERTYERLEKAKDKAFDLTGYAKGTQDMISNLKYQQAILRDSIQAMDSMKVKDKAQMKEYQQQIEDIEERIKELREEFYNEMRGTDLASAADEFATAWVEALLQGEDSMEAFSDKFDDMIKQMIIKQASLRVVSGIMKSLFDDIDLAIGEEGEINESEIKRINQMIPDIMRNLDNAMNAIIKPLMDAAGITNGNLGGGKSGLQLGIQSIQEETAGQLVALLNTMRYLMYKDSDRLASMELSLFSINSFMGDSLTEVRGIHSLIKEMRLWQQSITFAGHPQGGNGLKVFSNN